MISRLRNGIVNEIRESEKNYFYQYFDEHKNSHSKQREEQKLSEARKGIEKKDSKRRYLNRSKSPNHSGRRNSGIFSIFHGKNRW